MARTPASVRHMNPGAQWPGDVATRWGSTGHEVLNDGQGNKIATFPTWEQGAAAHIDLLRSKYAGMPLDKAIEKWSGGNNSQTYVDRVARETGLDPRQPISEDMLRSPQGLALVKSMALHEKGANGEGIGDDAWSKAHAMVFGGAPQPQTQVAAAAPGNTPGMLGQMGVLEPQPAEAPKDGGMLASLLAEPAPAEQDAAQPRGGLLASLFGETPKEKENEEKEAPIFSPMEAPQRRGPVDMSRVAAILKSRSRLGSA